MILCIRRDLKFDIRGSKFRIPRTSDLKPRTLVRPAIRAFHAILATGATHEQTD
jgi:hypothetical protein